MEKKVLAIIAEGFEEVEVVTPIDLLRRAGVKVTVAGLDGLQITGSHGITLVADVKLASVRENFDALVLHGGSPGAQNLAASPEVSSAISSFFNGGKIIAAICASPALVLAPTGILDGRKACGFPGMEDSFSPTTEIVDDPVVIDGNIITSRGFGTAHAFGLSIIEVLLGKAVRDKVAKATLFGA